MTNNNFEKQQIKYNKISAWSAIIASVATLFGIIVATIGVILAWQSLQFTKEMESLRFRPHITIHSSHNNEDGVLISIKNNGPGAAVIDSVEFWSDQYPERINVVFEDKVRDGQVGQAIRAVFGEDIRKLDENKPYLKVRQIPRGEVLANGDAIKLFRFNPKDAERQYQDLFFDAISVWTNELGGHISVRYCSLDGGYCDTQSN